MIVSLIHFSQGPLACVMAPTRELAQQIDEECGKLCRFSPFKSVCVVGGQDIEEQGFKLRKGMRVLMWIHEHL